ncbi:MAG: hypothetical protein U0P30_11755 [Vicinamibacterales bacterium]
MLPTRARPDGVPLIVGVNAPSTVPSERMWLKADADDAPVSMKSPARK